MEKTNTHKTSEAFDETSRMTSKWWADNCSSMANFYEKQLRNVWGAYSNFFDATGSDKNGYSRANQFSPFGFGSNFYRSLLSPFNLFKQDHNYTAAASNYFEEVNKQVRDFKNRMFALWTEEFKNSYANWDEFNKLMEQEWSATQNRINSLHEAYMKHLNNSLEFNKKIASEMNVGFETAIASNKKMWDEILKKTENPEKTEKETDRKEWHPRKHARELAHH
ncbi:MAG: hypothetical protein ACXVNR_08965 [Bacteroidia bacterium]